METDLNFLNDFLNLAETNFTHNFKIKTQVVYKFGRPDIEIFLDDLKVNIIVECKIDHFERLNQLKDYCSILEENASIEKHLIYLTKNYECKELDNSKIKFHQIKWADIYLLVDDFNLQCTQELKKYIKEQNMSDSNNFQYQDLSVLKSITSTIKKMDEVLDAIKPVFESIVGKFSKDSSRSTRLVEERYNNYHSVTKNGISQFSIEVGFYWWDEDIYAALRVFIPNKSKNKSALKLKDFFVENLIDWELENWEESFNLWYFKPLAQFIVDESEQIPAIVEFLELGIKQLSIVDNA